MSAFSATLTATPTEIAADPQQPKEILNVAGGVVYHKNAKDVDSGDTELAEGGTVQITETKFFISSTGSEIVVRELSVVTAEDITAVDDLTVKDDLTVLGKATVAETLGVTGVTTPTGGVASSGTLPGEWAGGVAPTVATDGTDSAVAEKVLHLTGVWLPANKTLTGVGFLVGSVGAKGKVVVGLFNAAGEVLAKSSEVTEGTATGAAAGFQEVAFTAAYAATGPRLYYIGVTGNNAEDKIRTITVGGSHVFAGEVELAAKQVLATVAPPATFTASKGPVGYVY